MLPSPTDFSGPLVLSEPATLREKCSNALLDEVATNSYRRCKDCLQPKVADRRNGTLGLLTCAGCVALPRFSCTLQQMRGTATLFAHQKTGQKRRADCDVACYTGLERCPAYSGSLVLVLAPLSLQLNSGAIYFSRNEPFASLPPHQDEPDDSDDDQKYLACRDYRLCVHGQPPFSRSCPSAAKHLVRDSSVRRRKPTDFEGPLQVNFRNRESRLMCGTATALAQHTPDVWYCHGCRQCPGSWRNHLESVSYSSPSSRHLSFRSGCRRPRRR